ncbi:MAG: MFS transporter [Burkholderiaceae bacterium]|nr:MFS transporter [Sulfuritalea sp.]MCF8174185.1 MFS transporter [Burkholderiaceae bacterium]
MTLSIRTETDWRAVLAALLCGIAVAMNVGKVPIALPLLRAEFGLSLVAAGWVSSMINTLAIVSGVFVGLLGDRFGALRTCLAGLAISILGGVLGMLAGNELVLLVSRFAEGAGVVAVAVSAPALLSSASAPVDRRFALSIWSSYMPTGVALAMLLAPAVIPFFGWRGIWLLTLAVLCLAAAAIHRLRPAYRLPPPTEIEAHPLAAAKEALAQPAAWLLAFAMGCWTIQYYALVVWLPTFLKEQRDLGTLTVSILSCLVVIANAPGNLYGGKLLQRGYPRGKLIAASSLLTGLCGFGVFLDLLPDLLRYGLCVALSLVGGLIPAAVLSASASLARTPKQIGTLQGLFMQVGNLGSFISPPLIAVIVAASGLWRDALWVTNGAALLGVVLGLSLYRLERRSSH